MDTRRTFLWMIFAMSLLMLWDGWSRHNGHAGMFGMPVSQQAVRPQADAVPANAGIPTTAPGAGTPVPSTGVVPSAAPAATASPAAPHEKVSVTTDLMAADIDTEGAQVVRLELLKHRDQQHPDRNMLLLEDEPGVRTYIAQTGLAGAPGSNLPNHRTPFVALPGARTLAEGATTLDVAFEAESGGVKLRKIYTFKRGSYDIGVRHEIVNNGAAAIAPRLYLQITRDGTAPAGESRFMTTYTGPVVYSDAAKYKKVAFSDIDKDKVNYEKHAKDGWIAMIQLYFVTAWVPTQNVEREVQTVKVDNNLYAIRALQALPSIEPGTSATVNSDLFVGPQDQKTLEAIAPGLDLVVDYGWLTFIAKPLFWLLQFLHGLVGNWGWAVIALTVVIKAAFYPLSAASYKSMAKMKAVAPRLKKLQEQYADDKQKLNAAMMELYRTEKINPVGGCLPMLIQMPVFIALYWTVLAAVEMRGAPWLGWITDLTAQDPYYILPVIMIGTMFVQQRLNPTPPDPIQAKVFMVMPLVFGGMMIFFPSALVLYWIVNNILSIAQQWQITRMIEGKPLFGRAA
jgi:YidC/Oxa1 family membrane protein insertase